MAARAPPRLLSLPSTIVVLLLGVTACAAALAAAVAHRRRCLCLCRSRAAREERFADAGGGAALRSGAEAVVHAARDPRCFVEGAPLGAPGAARVPQTDACALYPGHPKGAAAACAVARAAGVPAQVSTEAGPELCLLRPPQKEGGRLTPAQVRDMDRALTVHVAREALRLAGSDDQARANECERRVAGMQKKVDAAGRGIAVLQNPDLQASIECRLPAAGTYLERCVKGSCSVSRDPAGGCVLACNECVVREDPRVITQVSLRYMPTTACGPAVDFVPPRSPSDTAGLRLNDRDTPISC